MKVSRWVTLDLGVLCEQLTDLDGPRRALDARLAVMCGNVVIRGDEARGFAFFHGPAKAGDGAFLSGCRAGLDDAFHALGTCVTLAPFTACLTAAQRFHGAVLPGWWWTAGHCALTSHASVGPDRAHVSEPELTRFDQGFHADITNPSTPAIALIVADLRALIAKGLNDG